RKTAAARSGLVRNRSPQHRWICAGRLSRSGAHVMKTVIFAALAFIASLTIANAQALYNHNGSIMRVVEQGNTVRILYEQPRQGMAQIGVRPGTLLFEGQLDANRYLEGLSRIFSARCGELDYYVYGQYQRSGDFTLNGAAPVLESGGCRVIDNTYDGSN